MPLSSSTPKMMPPHASWWMPLTQLWESDTAVGVLQQNVDGTWCPIAFFSRTMTPAETHYSTLDRELLAAYLAIKHFRHSWKVDVFISSQTTNPSLLLWTLILIVTLPASSSAGLHISVHLHHQAHLWPRQHSCWSTLRLMLCSLVSHQP